MAWTVIFYPFNLLALGSTTVTGTDDNGFPKTRLYDRSQGIFWKSTITEAKDFTVDQSGITGLGIDFLAIPGHNFDGKAMQWQYSSDDFSGDVNDAVVDWTQSGNNQIIRSIGAPVTEDYWRVTLASITNPQADEIYMSLGYSYEAKRESTPSGRDIANVKWNKTIGGNERSTKFGGKRRSRTYSFRLTFAEYAEWLTIIEYMDGYSKPFFIKDHQDNYFMVRFSDEPDENFDHNTTVFITVYLIEQL